MTSDLFLASILFSAGCAATVYVLLSARLRRRGGEVPAEEFDLTPVESRLADLVTDLNRVANSHTKAIADRRDELKRAIEIANDRIRRLNTMLADLAILEQRLRDPQRLGPGLDDAEDVSVSTRGRRGAGLEVPEDGEGDSPGMSRPIARQDAVEDFGARSAGRGPVEEFTNPAPPRRRRVLPPSAALEREVPVGGAWAIELPGPVDGQERARNIESLAAEGLSPGAIAARLRLPIAAVERTLEERRRH